MIVVMRVRERDTRGPSDSPNTYEAGPNVSRIALAIRPSGTFYGIEGTREYIEDVSEGYEGENPCFHYFETNSVDPISILPWYGGGSPGTILSGSVSGPGGTAMEALLSAFRTVNHPDTTPAELRWNTPDWSAELWYDMYPTIKAELNSLNSVYELKDFRMLPSLVNNTVKTAKRIYSSMRSDSAAELYARALGLSQKGLSNPFLNVGEYYVEGNKAVRNTIRSLRSKRLTANEIGDVIRRGLGLTADHFLNWKFAVEPLFKDYAALTSAATRVTALIDGLLERADGRVVSMHRAKTLDADEIGLDQVNHADSLNGWTSLGAESYRKVCALTDDVTYRLTVRYSYSYPKEIREFAHELGALDALGINMNAATLWRACRYTFVIDWFLKIGAMLDRLKAHNLEPVVNIHGGCDSCKYSYRADVEVFPYREYIGQDPNYVWNGCNAQSVAKRRVTVYIRKKRIPSLLGMPKTSDFSTMEKLLTWALIVSGGQHTSVTS